MKKVIILTTMTLIFAGFVFAATDHSSHLKASKSDNSTEKNQTKKMSCMDKKNEVNEMSCMCKKGEYVDMVPLTKSLAEDIVEEQILANLKGYSFVKSEKNGQGFDVYIKDANGNNFKITLKGHIMSSGLISVK